MSELARVVIERKDGIPIATVRGEIDLSNAADVFGVGLEDAMGDRAPAFVLDLSDVSYIDSSGIRALFELSERVSALGKRVVTVVPDDAPIRRVLELAEAPAAIALRPSVDDAMASIQSG